MSKGARAQPGERRERGGQGADGARGLGKQEDVGCGGGKGTEQGGMETGSWGGGRGLGMMEAGAWNDLGGNA